MKNSPVKEFGPTGGNSVLEQALAKGLTPATNQEQRKFNRQSGGQTKAVQTSISATATSVAQTEDMFPRLSLPKLNAIKEAKAVAASATEQKEQQAAAKAEVEDAAKYVWQLRELFLLAEGDLARKLRQADIDQAEKELLDTQGGLMRENDVYRQFYVVTFAHRMMQTCPLNEDDLLWMVNLLVPFGFFRLTSKDDPKGNFIFGTFVKLGEEYQDDDSKVIAKGVSKIQEDIRQQRKSNWIQAERAIEAAAGPIEAQLPIEKLGYANGKRLLVDPGWTDKFGKEKRGGKILILSTKAGRLEMSMATSGCQRAFENASEFDLTIFHIDEINNGMRDIRSETRGFVTALVENEKLSREEAERIVRNAAFAAFKTIQRAIDNEFEVAEETAGRVAEREHFSSLATLTEEEFFSTPRPDGAFLVDPIPVGGSYRVPKYVDGKPVYRDGKPELVAIASDVFFLFVSEGGKLTTPQFPKRLKGFFEKNEQAFSRLVRMAREKYERTVDKAAKAEARAKQEAKGFDKDFEATMLEAAEEAAVAKKKRVRKSGKSNLKTEAAES